MLVIISNLDRMEIAEIDALHWLSQLSFLQLYYQMSVMTDMIFSFLLGCITSVIPSTKGQRLASIGYLEEHGGLC